MKSTVNIRYKFIEQQLCDYKANKGLLVACTNQPSPVISHPNLTRNMAAANNSPTEKQALESVGLSERLEKVAWYVKAIDDLLDIAAEEEKLLLAVRYFQPRPLSVWQIADILHISRTEFYRRRDVLLAWLDKRMGYPVWEGNEKGA